MLWEWWVGISQCQLVSTIRLPWSNNSTCLGCLNKLPSVILYASWNIILSSEMYTKLAFAEHLTDEDKALPSVELPQVVPACEASGRPEKYLFHELQVSCWCSSFFTNMGTPVVWQTHVGSGHYMLTFDLHVHAYLRKMWHWFTASLIIMSMQCDDMFMWKTARLVANTPKHGLVYSTPKEPTNPKRVPKPNQKYV